MTTRLRPGFTRQHFTVPNNWWGRFVLWLINRYLNRSTYKLTIRGRCPNVKKLRVRWLRKTGGLGTPPTDAELRRRYTLYGVNPSDAHRLGVYVDVRDGARAPRSA